MGAWVGFKLVASWVFIELWTNARTVILCVPLKIQDVIILGNSFNKPIANLVGNCVGCYQRTAIRPNCSRSKDVGCDG